LRVGATVGAPKSAGTCHAALAGEYAASQWSHVGVFLKVIGTRYEGRGTREEVKGKREEVREERGKL
jgi:hypothetical protein